MSIVRFPYGKEFLEYDFEGENLLGILTSSLHGYTPELRGIELVKKAMESPIGSPSLAELAKGKKKIVLIASSASEGEPIGDSIAFFTSSIPRSSGVYP